MRGFLGIVTAGLLALGMTGAPVEARSLDDIIKSGVVRVGTYADQPPLSALNNKNELEGFDVDVANLIAKAMNVKLEIVTLTTEQRVPFLTADRIDISLGALTRTPSRALLVDFTIPLHSETVQVLTTENTPLKAWTDLNDPKYTLAAGRSTWTADMVKEKLPKAQTLLLEGPVDQVRAVAQGRASAIVDILATDMPFTKNYPDVKWRLVDAEIYNAWCGMGIKKGEEGLRNFLNVFIFDLHSKGVTQDLWAKWYGAPNPKAVPLDPNF